MRLAFSVALARTREALHNGRDKNDPKGAQVILHMLRIGSPEACHDPLVYGDQRHPGAVDDARGGPARQD